MDSVTFTVDATPPNMTLINITGITGALVTPTNPVLSGDNATFYINLTTDTAVDKVWVVVWQTIASAGNILWQGFLSLISGTLLEGVWSIQVPVNNSFPGIVNYTIYANDTLANIVNISGNFSANRDPIITNVNITPYTLYTNNYPSAMWSYSDPDSDSQNRSVYTWYINGTEAWRDNSLVAYWDLDGNINERIYGDTGTFNSAPINSSGKIKQSYLFDGSNDYINNGNSVQLNFTTGTDITYSAWIKPIGLSALRGIVGNLNPISGTYYGSSLSINAGWIGVYMGDGSGTYTLCNSNSVLSANSWQHITYTYNDNFNSTLIYYNGELSKNCSGTRLIQMHNGSSNDVWVSGLWAKFYNDYYFNGSIDEVKIWNRSLTAAEIKQEYEMMKYGEAVNPPVALWHFDEGQGNVVKDAVGGNDGTRTGHVNWTNASKFNTAVSFDGNGDYISVPDNSVLDITNTISISTWIKHSGNTAGYETILAKRGTSTNYETYLHTSTRKFGFYAGGSIVTSNISLPLNEWHHVVSVTNSTTTVFYLDGIRNGTTSIGIGAINNNDLTIGTYGAEYFNGSIDEVAIWNRDLSATEISDLYNLTRPLYSLDESVINKNTTVKLMIEPYDNYQFGTAVNSSQITINNSLPFIGNVTLNPAVVNNTVEFMYATWDYTDIDNDPEITTYTWYINNTIAMQFNSTTGHNMTNLTLPYYLSAGSNITLGLTPFDGYNYGAQVNSTRMVYDVTPLNISIINATDLVGMLITPLNPVETGTNATLYINISSDTPIDRVWVIVWQTIAEAGDILWQGFLRLVSGTIWAADIPVDDSFGSITNYTVYANDTWGNLANISGNFTVNQPPYYSNNATNFTTIERFDVGVFNLTWTDREGLSGYIFSTNATGPWTNSTWRSMTGTQNVSTNESIIIAYSPATIGWRYYVNDSDNFWNASEIFTFIVSDFVAPTIANQRNYTNNNIIYTFSANSTENGTCTLYGNFAGNWDKNETKNVTANILFNFTSVTLHKSTTYEWGINCSDVAGNVVWGNNYTFTTTDSGAISLFSDAMWYGEASGRSGYSVSDAGDFNGDGYGDIIIGATLGGYNGVYGGKVYLILGSVEGFRNYIKIDNSNASWYGEKASEEAGYSISGVGDVNRDGFDDILIGAPFSNQWGPYHGKAYLILGSAGGFTNNVNLSQSNASWYGEQDYFAQGDRAGNSVSGAGDVNRDGYDDFIVGAYYYGQNADNKLYYGKTYLILGSTGGWSNNINLSKSNASWYGEKADSYSGNSVSSAGDINGDGYDDILIGANEYSNTLLGTGGKTYLILGSAGGFANNINLSKSNASWHGENSGNILGDSVSGAGDVNGDGYEDILIAGGSGSIGGNGEGKLYLVLGSASGLSNNINISKSNASWYG